MERRRQIALQQSEQPGEVRCLEVCLGHGNDAVGGMMKAGQEREGSWEDGGGSCGPSQDLGEQGLVGARLSHTCSCSKSMRSCSSLLGFGKEEGLGGWAPPEPVMPAQGKKGARSLPLAMAAEGG